MQWHPPSGEIATAVARMLVVYFRRPGGQLQYSSLLDLDPESDRIRRALSFAREWIATRRRSSRRMPAAACGTACLALCQSRGNFGLSAWQFEQLTVIIHADLCTCHA
jgi:hypothetical protein